jgi:hypothetical protein
MREQTQMALIQAIADYPAIVIDGEMTWTS